VWLKCVGVYAKANVHHDLWAVPCIGFASLMGVARAAAYAYGFDQLKGLNEQEIRLTGSRLAAVVADPSAFLKSRPGNYYVFAVRY
jgi:hypothetical protein